MAISDLLLGQAARAGQPRRHVTEETIQAPSPPLDLSSLGMTILMMLMLQQPQAQVEESLGVTPTPTPSPFRTGIGGTNVPITAGAQPGLGSQSFLNMNPMDLMRALMAMGGR